MDALVLLIPFLPLLAAVVIGIGHVAGLFIGERREIMVAELACGALSLSCLMALTLLISDCLGSNQGYFSAGVWFSSEHFIVKFNFLTSGLGIRLAALFSLLLAVIARFAVNYLHRETGFYRFFFVFCLFDAAMMFLLLSANVLNTFIGWEVAGVCSYLLIAYSYQRPVATENATRVYLTNRVGDVGFIVGIGLCYAWLDSVNWQTLQEAAQELTIGEATGISLCFALAAAAKSAQLPFSPWLARAMEGPTPSSAAFYGAVMVHSGVFLLCLMAPVIEQSPFARAVIGLVGFATAVYGFVVVQTQTDIKSLLAFSIAGHLGLMFVECSLGLWVIASWHLCAHAVVRCWQLLTAPSLLQQFKPVLSASERKTLPGWLYIVSLQQFWLDQVMTWALINPIRGLSQDLSYFDDHVVDNIIGVPAPAIGRLSSLAQLEEERLGARLNDELDDFAHGSGFAGVLTVWAAKFVHWVEDRFVLRGVGKDAIHAGKQLGHLANKFEQVILRPRYLVLFVCITFLVAF
ncbi:proton-conducting transporter transmembrane domain-containing protein [Methylocucumis oryzae]|uniref:NADH-ubiquinone oxidoreductase n=1 Tax=Methylocucumis oryzae TaxID=1632867 RepID=A0A0F3INX6_9GAMM|nr:proton-conducting transporter membrane subunit [Methylocucumis oryzae]KJV07279.1 NADH-ubiquinone oxidoreductase [Methylocucumis oryzae]